MTRQLIPLALSVNTIVLMWLVGNRRVLGWMLGLAGQAGWFLFIVVFEVWGLLPLAIALTVVYGRNARRWRFEQKPSCCGLARGHMGDCAWMCSVCAGTDDCPDCNGLGRATAWTRRPCGTCGGSGSCPMPCKHGWYTQTDLDKAAGGWSV